MHSQADCFSNAKTEWKWDLHAPHGPKGAWASASVKADEYLKIHRTTRIVPDPTAVIKTGWTNRIIPTMEKEAGIIHHLTRQ